MTSSSSPVGSRCSRAWLRPSIGAASPAPRNPAASGHWTRFSAAAWSAARARLSWGRPVPASRCCRCSSPSLRWRAASGRRCSSSTRNWACCSTAQRDMGLDIEAHAGSRRPACRADRRSGAVAGRVRAQGPRLRRERWRRHGGDRQPQWLPGGDARGAVADPAHARAAAIPEPAGRDDLPDRGAARVGRGNEGADRRHLPCRYGHTPAVLRGIRPSGERSR